MAVPGKITFLMFFIAVKKIECILFMTTYPNIITNLHPFELCCRSSNLQSLTGFLKYLALLVQKLSKSVSGFFDEKKTDRH